MTRNIRIAIFSIAVILLVSFLCIIAYNFDNKYTKNTKIQPFEGYFTLSEEDLDSVVYPIKDWIFCSGELLKPEDLTDGSDRLYSFIDIGEVTHFEDKNDENSPHGYGSYILQMSLPEKEDTYALELTEIFSAYDLYINGELVSSMGSTEKDNYSPQTQNKLFMFEASGEVTILLSVSDFSHFYSGLVYPMAFGKAELVSNIREVNLLIGIAVAIIGLIATIFALAFAIETKEFNAVLFALLCISMAIFTSYKVVHRLFVLPIFPFYAIEMSAGYFVSFFVILLLNRILKVHSSIASVAQYIAIFFCGYALFYGLLSSHLTLGQISFFSTSVEIFKLAVLFYIVAVSVFYTSKHATATNFLNYSALAYATTYYWDRVFPTYEPIYGGWFAEFGSFCMVIAISAELWIGLIQTYHHSMMALVENRQMQVQVDIQSSYTKQMREQNEKYSRLTHDFRHHLRTISLLIQPETAEKSLDNLQNYVASTVQEVDKKTHSKMSAFCQNAAVDALIQYYAQVAKEQKIEIDFKVGLPEDEKFDSVEMCTMLGNLLENAIEACVKIEDTEKRKIRLNSFTTEMFFLTVENSFNGDFTKKGERFVSSKGEGKRMGIGVESVKEIVNKHSGNIEITHNSDTFKVAIMMLI